MSLNDFPAVSITKPSVPGEYRTRPSRRQLRLRANPNRVIHEDRLIETVDSEGEKIRTKSVYKGGLRRATTK